MATGTETRSDTTTATTGPRPTPRRGAKNAGDEGAVEELERALFSVARTILRLGIPAHALREGEHIDRSGYWFLTRLDESARPVRLSDLAVLLELDLSTVSRQARHLVDIGLVTRVADPADGRACRMSVSERGREVLGAVRDTRHDVLRNAMNGWASDERRALSSALARLADDLQGAPPPSGGS